MIIRRTLPIFAAAIFALSLPASANAAEYAFCYATFGRTDYVSGVIALPDRSTRADRDRMLGDFSAHVGPLAGTSDARSRTTCTSPSSSRSHIQETLARRISSFRQDNWTVRETGWTRDYAAGAASRSPNADRPAGTLYYAPLGQGGGKEQVDTSGESQRRETAGQQQVDTAYSRQLDRERQRIDDSNRAQNAYEAGVAEADRRRREYEQQVRDREDRIARDRAEYERTRAEWQARVDRCQSGDRTACSGQAAPQ